MNDPNGPIDLTAEVDRYFDNSSILAAEPPHAVIMAGGVCVGKTRFRREKYSAGFVVLDAAEIFLSQCRGRYLDFPGPLKELMDIIGLSVARRILKERRHFVTEITAAAFEPTRDLIAALRAADYHVDFVSLTCDLDVALERNANRGENNISAYYTEPYHLKWIKEALSF